MASHLIENDLVILCQEDMKVSPWKQWRHHLGAGHARTSGGRQADIPGLPRPCKDGISRCLNDLFLQAGAAILCREPLYEALWKKWLGLWSLPSYRQLFWWMHSMMYVHEGCTPYICQDTPPSHCDRLKYNLVWQVQGKTRVLLVGIFLEPCRGKAGRFRCLP